MAKFKVGDIVVIKADPQKKRRKIKEIRYGGDIVLEDAIPRFDECELEFAANSCRNAVVRNAMNGCIITNANAPMWIKDYKAQIKKNIGELDVLATQTFALLRDYGRAARDDAQAGARSEEWKELNKLGAEFLPDLRKVANIIQGLKRDADAL